MPVREIPRSYRNLTGRVAMTMQADSAPFESPLERDFYVLLDFDPAAVRVEAQPVRIVAERLERYGGIWSFARSCYTGIEITNFDNSTTGEQMIEATDNPFHDELLGQDLVSRAESGEFSGPDASATLFERVFGALVTGNDEELEQARAIIRASEEIGADESHIYTDRVNWSVN